MVKIIRVKNTPFGYEIWVQRELMVGGAVWLQEANYAALDMYGVVEVVRRLAEEETAPSNYVVYQ